MCMKSSYSTFDTYFLEISIAWMYIRQVPRSFHVYVYKAFIYAPLSTIESIRHLLYYREMYL